MNATILRMSKQRGVAGQYALDCTVQYPDEDTSTVTFVGSTYGGPVVMVTPANPRGTFVVSPDRFGEFGETWVRRFFGDQS